MGWNNHYHRRKRGSLCRRPNLQHASTRSQGQRCRNCRNQATPSASGPSCHLASVATLSTISRKHAGYPFGSLMPFARDSFGQPILLISNMAMHTQNLKADSRCSLFVGQAGADGDALGAARATLIGNAEPVPENDG